MRYIALLLLATCAMAQPPIPGAVAGGIVFVKVDPSGTCTNPNSPMQYNYVNGALWGCEAGSWTAISGGGGGATIAHTTNVIKGDNAGNGISAGFAATGAGIVSLFTGCSGILYLGADGACHSPGTGTVTTFSGSGPTWLTWTVSNPTTTPSVSLAPTTGQSSHQVIGTCNAATTFAPCALVLGDLPSGLGLTASPLSQFAATTSAQLAGVISDETGSGDLVFGTAPMITLANGTGLPISTGVSGLGTGCATWLGTPSSSNLAACVTDETGSGALVFGTSPTFVTPNLGTPATGNASNLSNLPITLTTTGSSGAATWTQATNTLNIPQYSGGGGSGGLTLVEQHTASSSASLDFTTCLTSTYDEYSIQVVGFIAATNTAVPLLRFSTDGGMTYDTSGIYDWGNVYTQIGSSTAGGNGLLNQSAIVLFGDSGGGGLPSSATPGMVVGLTLYDPLSASNYKMVSGTGTAQFSTNSNRYGYTVGGIYRSTAAVNAFRVVMSSGNIASGTVRCYGLSK